MILSKKKAEHQLRWEARLEDIKKAEKEILKCNKMKKVALKNECKANSNINK